MAKRVTSADAANASNGFDGDLLKRFIGQIENIGQEMESEKGAYMKRCRDLRDDINSVLEDAKTAGIPKKVLKAHIDLRKLERRKEAVVEKLSDDDTETFEMVADALGDFATLPLGASAVQRAGGSQADSDALGSLN